MPNPATAKKNGTSTSIFDPTRDTVGKIYRDLQMHGDHSPVIVGDLAHEFTKDLVYDINEALCAPCENDEPFYLIMVEKWDLQMPKEMSRTFTRQNWRPWPENNTTVFWKDPKTQELRFCWSLPHHSEMFNIENNPDQFDPGLVADVKAWKAFDMRYFGFYWSGKKYKWLPNPNHKDKSIKRNSSNNPSSGDTQPFPDIQENNRPISFPA